LAHWRTTSFRHTTFVNGNWIRSASQTLRPPCPRFAKDRKRGGNSRYQVYHPHPPGGPPGGLLLVGDGLRGSGKSQRRVPGKRPCRSLRILLCFFRFVAQVIQRSMVLMLCSLNLTLYLYFLLVCSLGIKAVSYHSDTNDTPQNPILRLDHRFYFPMSSACSNLFDCLQYWMRGIQVIKYVDLCSWMLLLWDHGERSEC